MCPKLGLRVHPLVRSKLPLKCDSVVMLSIIFFTQLTSNSSILDHRENQA